MTTTDPTRLALAASAAVAALVALALGLPGAAAGQARIPDEPLQILADVALIEAQCRTLNVDYGLLFAFAQRNGIDPVDIMPLGDRRAAFDAAYRRRAHDAKPADLCGPLAAQREAAVPGVFRPR